MSILGIIPARYASTRFPGKPLTDIGGQSMIQRVYNGARRCAILDKVVVATDDERIASHVVSFGGEAIMTSPDHASGTERCAEAAEKTGSRYEVIINIQGDEPFISPVQIETVSGCFLRPAVQIATLAKKIRSNKEIHDPNVVKVVFDVSGRALCFSRSPVPCFRGKPFEEWAFAGLHYKHIGIYGYRYNTLLELVKLPPCDLERAESLEQLRWLWNGYSIQVAETDIESLAVDTPSDLLKITNTNE